jgi:hypothetical protein
MSIIDNINTKLRLAAINTLLKNHPALLDMLITADGSFNAKATPEALDLIDPGDILVRLAWDLWNGGGESELAKALDILGQNDFEAFVAALGDYATMRAKIKYAHLSGSEND